MDTNLSATRVQLRCSDVNYPQRAQGAAGRARWRTPGNVSAPWVAVCDTHRRPLDVAVGDDEPVLTVTLDVRVELAGVRPDVTGSRTEAVETALRALEAVGARVTLVSVASGLVDCRPQPGAAAANASESGRE